MSLILSGTDGLSDVDGSAATPAIRGTDANTGIFFPAADTIAFAEGGAEVARFDSAGNFGIGTTVPVGDANRVVAVAAAGGAGFFMYDTNQGSTVTDGANIQVAGTNFYLYNKEAGFVAFGQNNTERMRINSSGYFKASNSGAYLNGTYHEMLQTGANNIAYFSNTNATAGDNYGINISYRNADPNGTGNHFIYCEGNSATQRMSVRSNGGIANYSGNNDNLSDRREKTNFAPAGSYLDKICSIPVQTFNYIDQNMEDDGGLTLGVVAQDVQAVAPELIMESNWAKKDEEPKMRLSIYQTDLQYALMKCIQEQQALITQLTDRITALENK